MTCGLSSNHWEDDDVVELYCSQCKQPLHIFNMEVCTNIIKEWREWKERKASLKG